jgi:hypothetical protein
MCVVPDATGLLQPQSASRLSFGCVCVCVCMNCYNKLLLLTTIWHVLKFQMQETVSRNGGQFGFAENVQVDLDYNVMAYTQKTIFVNGRNGQVHILLQQIWRVEIKLLEAGNNTWEVFFFVGVACNGFTHSPVLFPLSFSFLRTSLCHHIILELYELSSDLRGR